MNHRKGDPPTSGLAGREIETSGLDQRQRDMCLCAVRMHRGLTAREIEARLDIKAHKRLPELRALQRVVNGPERRCTVTGRMAMTWYPVEFVH